MKVFVTGASGFVGSAVIKELIRAGHQVAGLARSDESAKSLADAGVRVLRGSLENIDVLRKGAEESEGVVHLAFIHDFSKYDQSAAIDKAAIDAIGSVLKGSDRTLITTGGILGIKAPVGDLATEDDAAPGQPRASEAVTIALADAGVHASVIRLAPSVHSKDDRHGFVPSLIQIAKEKGVSAYIGDGSNRWPVVHVLDAAHLYRLALEKGTGGMRYNGVGEEGIPTRKIAETIGKNLNLPVVSKSPEDAMAHFGWMARFFSMDAPSSNEKTKQFLGWKPTQIGLIQDMDENYF